MNLVLLYFHALSILRTFSISAYRIIINIINGPTFLDVQTTILIINI